jgi:DNA-binding CsgD family transcriptional regulator
MQRMEARPEAFPPTSSRTGWRAAGIELSQRATLLCERAGAALNVDIDLSGEDPRTWIATLLDECGRQLRGGAVSALRCATLAQLASELRRLGDDLSERNMLSQARRLDDCERGLVRLRDVTTTAGLIDGVCDELIRSLGFKRAMLARVDDGTWRPWKANSAMLGESWLSSWIDQSIPLDELTLESRLLSEHRPELVVDTTVSEVAQMVRAAGVTSYVVAPIMPSGQVVGFFHADYGADGRTCDVADRDVLWLFAERFGHLYERAALLEQFHSRAMQVRKAVAAVNASMDVLTEPDLEFTAEYALDPPASRRPIRPREHDERFNLLTPREVEVLELIVAGARNSQIAEHLAITLATTKSHVRNLLGKLDAANRSQAIAVYLGTPS